MVPEPFMILYNKFIRAWHWQASSPLLSCTDSRYGS